MEFIRKFIGLILVLVFNPISSITIICYILDKYIETVPMWIVPGGSLLCAIIIMTLTGAGLVLMDDDL